MQTPALTVGVNAGFPGARWPQIGQGATPSPYPRRCRCWQTPRRLAGIGYPQPVHLGEVHDACTNTTTGTDCGVTGWRNPFSGTCTQMGRTGCCPSRVLSLSGRFRRWILDRPTVGATFLPGCLRCLSPPGSDDSILACIPTSHCINVGQLRLAATPEPLF